jgi:hypothetical protein
MLMTAARPAFRPLTPKEYTAPLHAQSLRLRDLLQSAKRVPEWGSNQINVFMSAGVDPPTIETHARESNTVALEQRASESP